MPDQRKVCAERWWTNLFFVNNIGRQAGDLFLSPHCMVHTWSIAVEFQMYLITPPFMLLAHALSERFGLADTPTHLGAYAAGWLLCAVCYSQ